MISALDRGSYSPSPIKRVRRSQAQLDEVLAAVKKIIAGEAGKITIRHLFYRLVSLKVIEKTECAYKLLISHLSKWRHAGQVEFTAFADNTRWYLGATTYDDAQDALENTVACYRKNLWNEQATRLEIWCEKDAVAGVLIGVADRFGVPVFVCRGFASLTSIHAAAMNFRAWNRAGKKCCIAYFGDHDPSGVQIERTVGTRFAGFGADVAIDRVAITFDQIREFDLPTRPAKTTDTRARDWIGGCVEIDALPSAELRKLVETSITKHINKRRWTEQLRVEEMERASLREMAVAFGELP